MTTHRDTPSLRHSLGMDRTITRRDFLNGAAVAVAGAGAIGVGSAWGSVGGAPPAAAQNLPGYYPPRRLGLRGSHPGSFEGAHALRDGSKSGAATDLHEDYDLIVVGAGISGLSAAHFFQRQAGKHARILIVDNHDDFGGHAKRNEFELDGQVALLNGGTLLIDSPRPYSPIAADLIRSLGIDVQALARKIEQPDFYAQLGLQAGVFFDRETFGADQLVVGAGTAPWEQLLQSAPLSEKARADIVRIEAAAEDFLPGLSSDEKKARLARMSYRSFLADVVKVEPAVIAFYQQRTQGEWSVGIDGVSALDCWGIGLPGFKGMQLARGSTVNMGYTAAGYADTGGSPRLHFPDGNATIARLLVRGLIPAAVPGETAEDVVSARVDYAALDRPTNSVRLRLNSIVLRAQAVTARGGQPSVRVTYLDRGKPVTVRGRGCVLACYNMMIPYLVPELPPEQQAALHSLVKEPLVYTSVALRNWRAFHALGISRVSAPGGYHNSLYLNQHVNVGAYRSPTSPDEPILVHMTRTPCKPGLPYQEQNRLGRAELLATSFDTFEQRIREQLNRTLAGGGFDAATDITGIVVNRWPHGYAREYNPLFDPQLPLVSQPHVIGRRPFGRITIANSDSGAAAYTDSAIDQAHRAVEELRNS